MSDPLPNDPVEDRELGRRSKWSAVEGLSTRAVNALTAAECDTLADIQRFGLEHFKHLPNCGEKTLHEIGALVGGWPGSTQGDAAAVIEDSIGPIVPDQRHKQQIVRDILGALDRAGYVILADRRKS